MTKTIPCFMLLTALAAAQTGQPGARSIGLREAIRIAMDEDADVRLARLAVERFSSDVALVRSEQSLQLYGRSGLGATSGIPQSIHGASPSVAQLTVRQPLVDSGRPHRARSAREVVRSGELQAQAAAEQAAYRAGIKYLDFELATVEAERRREERAHFERIEEMTAARVEEGVEIPLALTRARLDTARARDRQAEAESRAELLGADLGQTLGIPSDVRLKPEREGTSIAATLGTAAGTAPRAPDEHPEISALEASIRAARLRGASARSARHPKLDLVGQYALLARFNNYDDYFRRFQRHNWQAGIAVEIPIFTGRGVAEKVAQARIDERELALRQNAKRAALALAAQQAGAGLRAAERHSDLAKQELDYARESLDVLLAQFDEGRIALDELERGRMAESAAWGGLIEAQYGLAKSRLAAVYSAGRIRDAFAD